MTRILHQLGFYATTLAIATVVVFPVYWTVAMSLKTNRDAFANPPVWLFTPILDNYRRVLASPVFMQAFWNSVTVSALSTALAVALGAIAAYGIVNLTSRAQQDRLDAFILGLRIAPVILFVIPAYYVAAGLGALDSLLVLVLVYVFVNTPFAASLLVTFFREVPGELREAARLDGASEWEVFRLVYLPLSRGGVAATAVLVLIFVWNEFLIALVLTGRETQTLPVAITSFLTFQGIQWGSLTAAATLIMLPMLAVGLLVQRFLVRGLTLGSVK